MLSISLYFVSGIYNVPAIQGSHLQSNSSLFTNSIYTKNGLHDDRLYFGMCASNKPFNKMGRYISLGKLLFKIFSVKHHKSSTVPKRCKNFALLWIWNKHSQPYSDKQTARLSSVHNICTLFVNSNFKLDSISGEFDSNLDFVVQLCKYFSYKSIYNCLTYFTFPHSQSFFFLDVHYRICHYNRIFVSETLPKGLIISR